MARPNALSSDYISSHNSMIEKFTTSSQTVNGFHGLVQLNPDEF